MVVYMHECRSAEIDELRENKRGWSKNKVATSGTRPSRLSNDKSIVEDSQSIVVPKPTKRTHKPKNCMEFEREWQRLPSEKDAKMR